MMIHHQWHKFWFGIICGRSGSLRTGSWIMSSTRAPICPRPLCTTLLWTPKVRFMDALAARRYFADCGEGVMADGAHQCFSSFWPRRWNFPSPLLVYTLDTRIVGKVQLVLSDFGHAHKIIVYLFGGPLFGLIFFISGFSIDHTVRYINIFSFSKKKKEF